MMRDGFDGCDEPFEACGRRSLSSCLPEPSFQWRCGQDLILSRRTVFRCACDEKVDEKKAEGALPQEKKERKVKEEEPMPLYRRAVESFFFSMIDDPHSSSLLLFFPLLRALPSFSLRSLSRTESAPQSEGPYASSSLSALKQRKRTPKDTRKKDIAFAFD